MSLGVVSGAEGAGGWTRMLAAPLRVLWRLGLGAILCATAATSLLALGFMLRDSRREAAVTTARLALGLDRRAALGRLARTREFAMAPGWLSDPAARTPARRWFGGLAANLTAGLRGAWALALAAAPFGGLWALSWWAGWSNSFAKGYESAAVGPLGFLAGVAVAVLVMATLPMATARMAWLERGSALFELGAVWRLIGAARWRYLALSLGIIAACAPLLALRTAPVFVEHWRPGFADLEPRAQLDVGRALHFWTCLYIFTAGWLLKRWSARLYARAAWRAGEAPAALLAELGAPRPPAPPRRAGLPTRMVFTVTLAALWLAPPALILIGQFLNHSWSLWLIHPLLLLPWTPGPG